MKIKNMIITLSYILLIAYSCLAESALQLDGLTKYEVLKALGAPKEKIEHAVAQREIWRYPTFEIIFISGRVVPKHSVEVELVKPKAVLRMDSATSTTHNRNDIFKELEQLSEDGSISKIDKRKFVRDRR